jgi:uncharacterized membrane protein YcgQ (UPF0703/DUF1980 family)
MKILSRILAPLTLLEWGAILIYFYYSGRIAAFLHPLFRPLVLTTGILLVITAICVAIFHEEDCSHTSHDHDHEHDFAEDEQDQHTHSHGTLSVRRFLAFLILLLPLALAAKISPDSYGANLINNRGLVEDVRGLPGISSRLAKSGAKKVSLSSPAPAASPSLAEQGEALRKSINAAALALRSQPQQSSPGEAQPTVPQELANTDPPAMQPPAKPAEEAKRAEDEAPLPSNDNVANTEQIGDATVTYQSDFLKPNKAGNIKVEITDLLYAAQEPSSRKDFEGKRVELIGQLVCPKARGASTKTIADPNTFRVMRLVMVCCAADAMPAAVKIQSVQKPDDQSEMSWLKITGIVHFRTRPKSVGDDGIDYGDYPEPVILAEQIVNTPAPREKFIY